MVLCACVHVCVWFCACVRAWFCACTRAVCGSVCVSGVRLCMFLCGSMRVCGPACGSVRVYVVLCVCVLSLSSPGHEHFSDVVLCVLHTALQVGLLLLSRRQKNSHTPESMSLIHHTPPHPEPCNYPPIKSLSVCLTLIYTHPPVSLR